MAASQSSVAPPSPEQVRTIAAMADPVLRNLRITECYYHLSLAMTSRTGDCANWCTFATWASRQAGCTIRGEDMLHKLDELLREGSLLLHPVKATWRMLVRRGAFCPQTHLGRWVRTIHTPFDAFEIASDAVARGNLKVFDEIAYEFARYLASCPLGASVDSREFGDFVTSLRPGDPPEGQALLRRAFTLYQSQALEPDAVVRAQKVYLANVLIGLHEQTRLQPEIREALEAGPEMLRRQSLVARLARPLARYARALTCRVITECMMMLRIPPDARLYLGRHLDRNHAEALHTLTVPEVRATIDRYLVSDCGAGDWSDLEERMQYIANLFRCFQADPALLSPPFTSAQAALIASGSIPGGEL